ncbi:MAG: KEOPS complex subunit Pcc1 [Candidatus Thorarchaeota archaeon]
MSSIRRGVSVIRIPMDSEDECRILYQALLPETTSSSTDRSRVDLTVDGNTLILHIEANDLTALRASMNSYLSWISACRRTRSSTQNP